MFRGRGGLMKAFSQVDSEGKVQIPRNILIALGLKEKDAIELRIVGSGKLRKATISKRRGA